MITDWRKKMAQESTQIGYMSLSDYVISSDDTFATAQEL